MEGFCRRMRGEAVAHHRALRVAVMASPTAGICLMFGRRRGHAADARPDSSSAWMEDISLVAQARVDAEAFGALYDRYCDQIFRFIRRRLSDRESAEDVTAEVFIKALRAIDSYQPDTAPFSAWLYRIATNSVTDHLRSRRDTTSFDTSVDEPPPGSDSRRSVEDLAIDRLEADRVWAAVDRLTEAQRMAVTLRLGYDLPIAQIALRMDRSDGAVKLLLNRALTAVRDSLDASAREHNEEAQA